MEKIRITKLTSGFWCVWAGNEWLNAALPTEEAAQEEAARIMHKPV